MKVHDVKDTIYKRKVCEVCVCVHTRLCIYICGQKSVQKTSPRYVYFWNSVKSDDNILKVEI